MAFLEITLDIADRDRPAAAGVYSKYRDQFLTSVAGATSKTLLLRPEDVQVLHGFDTVDSAAAYLESPLFTADIVGELGPLLVAPPEVRIYDAA
jgi:hypothetical protein